MSDIFIEIHLSPATPQEVIQQIQDLTRKEDTPTVHRGTVEIKASARTISSAEVQLSLIPPAAPKTGKESLEFRLKVVAAVAGIVYYVSGTPHHIVQFLEDLKPYIQETKSTAEGRTMPFDQIIRNLREQSQPTPKDEHHEQSRNPSTNLSEGD